MPSRNTKDDRRMSKHLPVSSKCLAIVLSATKTHTDETVKIPTTVHNGKDLLEDFKLINKTCYWNPALVASIRSLTYKGYVEPTTILVVGNEIHLENLRTAWGRRVLKAPAGFTIELIGDVDSIEMQVIPQTQFIPLPDALCLITMDLNNRCIVATLDTIKEKLFEWYKEMTMPSDKLIFDTLGCLIQERKVFHSGNGYFVVTPDTYCIQTDYHNISYNKSWLPYHSMYIPVFPQMEGLKPNHQHQQHFYKHHMHDPMHLVHCPANVNDEVKPVCEVCKSENKAEVKQRPRSNSVRVSKTVEKDKDWCKEAITGTEETLKRSVSLRYKTDKVKSVKDINLKDSNINKDKEKGQWINQVSS